MSEKKIRSVDEKKGGSGILTRAQARVVVSLYENRSIHYSDKGTRHKAIVQPGNQYVTIPTIRALLDKKYIYHTSETQLELTELGKTWCRVRKRNGQTQ